MSTGGEAAADHGAGDLARIADAAERIADLLERHLADRPIGFAPPKRALSTTLSQAAEVGQVSQRWIRAHGG